MRRTKHRRRDRCMVWMLAVLFCASCAASRTQDPEAGAPLETLLREPGSRIAVVLPFENRAKDPEIGVVARTAFYSHFSPKRYLDIEPSLVDQRLGFQEGSLDEDWRDLSPVELGKLFRADFVIYGRVLRFERVFLGVYAQIVLTLSLEMVSCRTGTGVWQKTLTRRSHEGGLPFSLLGVVPAALRSGLHMQQERTVGLADQVGRELAAAIPEPAPPSPGPSHFEIQVASFLDPVRAEITVRQVETADWKGRIETVSLEGRVHHRVLLGPFLSAVEAEEARKRIAAETTFRPIVIHRKTETVRELGG